MLGDTTLFARHDFVETSWALITPVLEAWAAEHDDADRRPTRPASGDRPEADQLIACRRRAMEDIVTTDAGGCRCDQAVVPFSEDRRCDGARHLSRTRGAMRALVATVVAVGPVDRLGRRAGTLEALGDAGTVRGILISEGNNPSPPAQVAGNTVT